MSQANSTQMQQKNQIETAEVLAMAQALVDAQTNKPTLKEKLKSRKFWTAIAGIASGIFGILNANGNTTAMVVFVILQIASVVAYCVAEGTIDAARAKQLAEAAAVLIEMLGGSINAEDYVNGNLGISTCSTDDQPETIEHCDPAENGPAAPQDETIPVEFRA